MTKQDTSIRWWPAAVVLGLALVALAVLWWGVDTIRQFRMMGTYALTFLVAVLLLFWAVFFSRFRMRTRLAVFAAAVLFAVLAVGLVRVRGMTGDWIPVLAWSWEADPDSQIERRATGDVATAMAQSVGDFPQFLGPRRNARLSGVGLHRDWQAEPPQLLWRQPIGAGWAGFAVVDGIAVTLEQRGAHEMVVAYALESGEELWSHAEETRFDQNSWVGGVGPRSTPAIAEGAVYTLGATGVLSCLDLRSGRRHWSHDVLVENRATSPEWGKAGSPLLVGDLVVLSAGGTDGRSLVAYDRTSGEQIWTGGNGRSSYSSPFLATLAGREQIVIFNYASIAGHDPADGRVLWEHPWPSDQPNVAQPLPLGGDRLLVSAGYGVGSKLFQIREKDDGGLEASIVWETPRLKAKFTQVVEHDGYVYGLDDGVMTCLDPATGERRWKRGRYGHGQVLLVDDLLFVQTERGEVVLVEPSPEGLREVTSFAALDGKVWNPPTLAGPYLLVRNDLEAVCYRLPADL